MEKRNIKKLQFSLQLSAIFSEALKLLMYIIMMYMILHTFFCRTKGKFGRRYGLGTSFMKAFGSFNGIFFGNYRNCHTQFSYSLLSFLNMKFNQHCVPENYIRLCKHITFDTSRLVVKLGWQKWYNIYWNACDVAYHSSWKIKYDKNFT